MDRSGFAELIGAASGLLLSKIDPREQVVEIVIVVQPIGPLEALTEYREVALGQ